MWQLVEAYHAVARNQDIQRPVAVIGTGGLYAFSDQTPLGWAVGLAVGLGGSIATGYVVFSQKKANADREMRQKDEDDQRVRTREDFKLFLQQQSDLEDFSRGSLKVQIEALTDQIAILKRQVTEEAQKSKEQVAEEAGKSHANELLWRKTLHDVSNQLQVITSERDTSRLDLVEALASSGVTARMLEEANVMICDLKNQIADMNVRLAEHEKRCPGHVD